MPSLHISSTPHIHQTGASTRNIMLDVVIAMLPARGRSQDFIGLWSCALLLVQMIPMIGSIFFVEKALKETFDEDGNRR